MNVPKKRHRQKSAEPVCDDVDCSRGVVDIRQRLGRIASSALNRSVPRILHWPAVEDDVQKRNEVHGREHCRHSVQTVGVREPIRSDADQHERNAQLDRDDGCTVKDLEEEEILPYASVMISISCGSSYLHASLLLLFVKSELMDPDAIVCATNAGGSQCHKR